MGATESNKKYAKRRNGLKGVSGAWEGFVDVVLTQAQKEHLAGLLPDDQPDLLSFLLDVLSDGYKLSLSPDTTHNCVIATLTGRSDECVNVGFSLSARGPDLPGALLCLWFKHTVICESGRWAGRQDNGGNQLSMWG